MAKRILVLGSTGSIGTSALDVIRDYPGRFELAGISALSQLDLLARQIDEFRPPLAAITDSAVIRKAGLSNSLHGARLLTGENATVDLVRQSNADMLVVATVGYAGLLPTLAGIEKGMTIALANKEVLVAAGEMVMERARNAGVAILPVDSEHNAVFQCLAGNDAKAIRRILLTASGGPFLRFSQEALDHVTVEQALRHPTWSMGRKITIDCATMMNKGFEVIEACHLFGLSADQVEVLVHPQSTVHSMVEFTDGSVLAHMGPTNMYLPILNVLSYPERWANKYPSLDLASIGSLHFEHPDMERFPCLRYAYEAMKTGGTLPAAVNAANEVAVGEFLAGRLPFTGIPRMIREAMDHHSPVANPDLGDICETDRKTREMAKEYGRTLA